MRIVKSFDDVNSVLKPINDLLDKLRTQNWDLAGKRVINAGPSRDDYDYILRKELYTEVAELREANKEFSIKLEQLTALVQKLQNQIETP